MLKISYAVFDPTKNITLLAVSPVARDTQAAAAAELMRRFPEVEQVGFLEPPDFSGAQLHLQMMGGEFCGNAAMSAAAYLAGQAGLPAGRSAGCSLTVSGAAGVLTCQVENTGDFCLGTVAMPLPETVGPIPLPPLNGKSFPEVPAVRFPGIAHCIVPAERMTRRQAEEIIRPLCASLSADACGILLWDAAAASFAPLVYVAATDTAVWESGCGSGSAAIGAYLALQPAAPSETALRQPGGVIRVRAERAGARIVRLSITGSVRELTRGEAVLSL